MTVNRGRRRTLGWLGMLAIAARAKAQIVPVEVAGLSEINKVGWSRDFEFHGRPALVVRTAKFQAGGLETGAIFLLAYLLECTHAGCTVSLPGGGTVLGCPCHGSQFDLESGNNIAGPARDPLPKVKLELRADKVWAVGFVD